MIGQLENCKNNHSTYVTKPTLSVILLNTGDSEIDSLTRPVTLGVYPPPDVFPFICCL